MSAPQLHRGAIFHMLDDPDSAVGDAFEYFADGGLFIEDGVVAAIGDWQSMPDNVGEVVQHDGLITPGFIDAHVHYPQVDVIASYGEQLLGWLENFTFPVEQTFSDIAHARETASFFLDELLRNGTTCASVFGTVHPQSVDALFEAAQTRNMRLIGGKVLMDRGAPEALLDTAESGFRDSEALIARWHGKGRLSYAVTPRFAVTSTSEQLAAAGQLLAAHPDVYLQTHLAENDEECDLVGRLFPDATDYLNVYEKHGLVRPRSIFAHGVQLHADGFARLAAKGGAIAFCPSSNLFLGSGLFDLQSAVDGGVEVALGSDVGGGTSLSMLATISEAYKVCRLRGGNLNAFKAFYLATLGGARALRLDDRIGNLAPGKEADFIVLDETATPLLKRRMAHANSLHEKLFAFALLGDDRVVAKTYVAGALRHRRQAV